jgi:hypothetical protein
MRLDLFDVFRIINKDEELKFLKLKGDVHYRLLPFKGDYEP